MSHISSSAWPPSACSHNLLNFTPSAHAAEVGYCAPTAQQQATAIGKRKRDVNYRISPATFPAPLVLPGDELSLDPQCPGQSLDDWRREKDRNEVTREKNVIYVAAPPDVASDVELIRTWCTPQPEDDEGGRKKDPETPGSGSLTLDSQSGQPFEVEDVLKYLAAFYHGMPVKMLPAGSLCFTSWGDKKPKNSAAKSRLTAAPRFIGLNTTTECIRVRTRASLDGIFPRQLNLSDLIDTAISILPQDAYALLLLTQHDLFEDADDEFVCGRAYGGSRVAVISIARYNPSLDTRANVECEHAWPASHCASYMKACCEAATTSPKATKAKRGDPNPPPRKPSKSDPIPPLSSTTPALQAAISAFTALPPSSPSPVSTLWLSRVCRTVSHELGHCFGIDHCVYHACAMQGAASLGEDVRQPPYLCPVDLAKVLEATRNGGGDGDRDGDGETESAPQRQRYEALLAVCTRHQDAGMLAAFGAWIRVRLSEREGG